MFRGRALILGLVGLALLGAAPARPPASAAPALEQRTYLPIIRRAPSPPPPPPRTLMGAVGSTLDGVNGLGYYPGNLDQNLPLRLKSFAWMRAAGVNFYRNYGSDNIVYSWPFVELAQGEFYWDVWDQLVQAAQQADITLLATIGNGVPQWANNSPSWRDPPVDLWFSPWEQTHWYRYVRAFVERYDGDGVQDMPGLTKPVKHWEFYNEPELKQGWLYPAVPDPPAHQFNGSVHDYVRLTQVGYAAVKAADPSALVVGPATAQAGGNTDSFPHYFIWLWPEWVNAGGLGAVDAVSFTRYMDGHGWDYNGHLNGYIDQVLGNTDGARGGKPVWFTETSWSAPLNDPDQVKARNFVRLALILWERPFVDKFLWYGLHQPNSGGGQPAGIRTLQGSGAVGVEPDPLLEPLILAMDVFQRTLAGFTLDQRPAAMLTPENRVYRFDSAEAIVWVAWHRNGTGSSTVYVDTGGRTVRRIGLLGEDLGTFAGGDLTVGVRPIYLTTRLDWNPNLGRITGRVRGSANTWNNGLAGVTVQISGPVNATTSTDADGNYLFSGLPQGTYTVSVPGHTTSPASRTATVNRETAFGRTSFTVTGP